MFKALPPHSQIATEPRYIVSLRRSTNTIELPVGGRSSIVRASIIGLCTRQGLYEVYVFLGSAEAEGRRTADGTLFRCEPAELDLEGYEKKLVEAVQMVERQGFAMGRVEFRAAPDEQKQALIAILPFAPSPPRASGSWSGLGNALRPSGAFPALGTVVPRSAHTMTPTLTPRQASTSQFPAADRLADVATLVSASAVDAAPEPQSTAPHAVRVAATMGATHAKTQATDAVGRLLTLL